jgi:protein gp37
MFAALKRKGWDPNIVRLTGTWKDAFACNATAKKEGKCALVFTCSYSDFFHEDADRWREDAWEVIRDCQNLVWLILTKRPERIVEQLPADWGGGYPNVWLGTTCGTRASYERIDILRSIPCALRFLSLEPLLESLQDIDLAGVGWILVGGMSGPLWKKRTMQIQWASELYDRSKKQESCAYFFKQVSAYRSEWGIDGLGRHRGEKDKDGKWKLFREFPRTPLPLMPLDIEKGRRFKNDKEWNAYLSQSLR